MINLLFNLNVMFCDIKGEVKNPGVYEITNNNNINDVINFSGGLTKNSYVNNINLSKKVTDEMVIYIPSKYDKPKECPPCNCPKLDCKDILPKPVITTTREPMTSIITTKPTTTTKTTKPTTTTKTTKPKEEIINTTTTSTTTKIIIVNINTATYEELQTIHGVGEKVALKIIEYRKETPFIVIEDLLNVKGIGETTFAKIKDFITV